MKYFAFLILISFGIIALSGAMVLDHRMENSSDNCIGSVIDNAPCPTELVARLIHHTSASQTILTAIVPSINPLLFFILIAAAFTAILSFLKNILSPKLNFLHRQLSEFELITHKARQKFVSWLSLLEHSPSF